MIESLEVQLQEGDPLDITDRLDQLNRTLRVAPDVPISFASVVRALARLNVEYVIVGTAAAFLCGVPCSPGDLDVAVETSPGNMAKVSAFMAELTAEHAVKVAAVVRDSPNGAWQLTAVFGFDLVFVVDGFPTFELVTAASEQHCLDGRPVRVLRADAVDRSKRAAGRPKDLDYNPAG